MKSRDAVIRLKRFEVEEKRRKVAEIEAMIGETMPAGYRFGVDPDAVARAVLSHSTWAVLGSWVTRPVSVFTPTTTPSCEAI